jgi:nucleoside-diphosphate-sugar epimerase
MIRMMATGPAVTGSINIGNPREFTIRELAEIIVELTGSKSKLVDPPLPSDDPRQRRPDIRRAEAALGWRRPCRCAGVSKRQSPISATCCASIQALTTSAPASRR